MSEAWQGSLCSAHRVSKSNRARKNDMIEDKDRYISVHITQKEVGSLPSLLVNKRGKNSVVLIHATPTGL